jgi:aminoglycoside 6'-N-acetyltransferase I
VRLRSLLWPEAPEVEHRAEAGHILSQPERFVTYVAIARDERVAGFSEGSLRFDYVNGCESSPVVFLEGIYVTEADRGKGVARLLAGAVEAWGRERGCREFASDALLDNETSHTMHRALGFAETERVVCFRKLLDERLR